MKFLTPSDVIIIHDEYVKRFGGSLGIRDEKLLESAVYRCQSSFGGKDLYLTIFEKASTILESILLNHPFVDGNKRTALFSASRFFYINGYDLKMSNEEAVAFPLAIEKVRPDVSTIAQWLKEHAQKIKEKRKKVKRYGE